MISSYDRRAMQRERRRRDEHVVVSIDQSFSNYAMVKWENGVPVDRCVFHTGDPTAKKNANKPYGEYFESPILQLNFMYIHVLEKLRVWNADDIVVEGLAFSAKGNQERQLGALYFGLMVSMHRELGLQYDNLHVVTPTQCKAKARDFMTGKGKYATESTGEIIRLRSGKLKLNPMKHKKEMLVALRNTPHSWIVDGYTHDGLVAARSTETGLYDLPDAYFMGVHLLESMFKHKFERPKEA